MEISHSHLGRGKASLTFKLKNLEDNTTLTKTFNPDEDLEAVEVIKKKIQFLYSKSRELIFIDAQGRKYQLDRIRLRGKDKFLKKDLAITGLFIDDKLISIELPIKAVFRVVSAPPGLKGDSEKTNTKIVVLETGAQISAPLFVNAGDQILVNLEKEEYVERVK
mgnify:CR=1 FL=1